MIDDWLLWQLADSAFPTGGFAHSGGLEAAFQHGAVCDGGTLAAFLSTITRQAERGLLPFVVAAWRAPEEVGAADAACDLFLNSHVANRASRAQGRALLTSAARIYRVDAIGTLDRAIRTGETPGHLAPAWGVTCRALGLDEQRATSLFLFVAARSVVSSAVRLGIVGPLEGQAIQATLARERKTPAMTSADAGPDAAVQTAPILDLLHATQDRLYSRLFQS
jgi:urease accessory protein